MGMPMVV
jgi:hypothetical protein